MSFSPQTPFCRRRSRVKVGKAEDVLPKLLGELPGELDPFVFFKEHVGGTKKPSLISFRLVGKKTVFCFLLLNRDVW